MGCWDIYCVICGNGCHNLFIPDKVVSKKMKWLEKCTMLLANDEIVHGCKEFGCNVMFSSNNNKYSGDLHMNDINYFDNSIRNRGIFIHTDCWKFVKNNYKISLKYSDLPVFITKKYKNAPIDIDYGVIKKYWEQFADYEKMYQDNNIYMAYSPLSKNNTKNIIRIKKIINQLKLKKDSERKGPSVSATFFKEGDVKIGNNKKFWIKSGNKWMELNEKVITKEYKFIGIPKSERKINLIPQIGESNKIPLFVSDFYKYRKNNFIELVGTEKTLKSIVI